MKNVEKIINLQQVKLMKNQKTILRDITWEVKKGEHWAILGLNGSGKTSLLNILTGYQWKSGGEVTVLNQRFGQTNVHELRKSIGFVSASIDERLLTRPADTPLEVVLSGKTASVGLYETVSSEDIDFAETLLDKFHVHHLAAQPFHSLSQGERKRVILARAWMTNPEIIILDEPCSGLDILSREQLLETIQQLAQDGNGPTLLYVSHHIEEIIPAISHVLLIRSGSIVKSGPKNEVLTDSHLSETFKLPVHINWEDGRPWVSVKSKNINE